MKWKIFMMACVSAFIISFPQNIIGCGPGVDPYDYYTSFLNPAVSPAENLRPFWYTGYTFLYDEEEPVKPAEMLANEWAAYCGVPVTDADAKAFVMQYPQKDIGNLYFNIEKKQPLKIPDSMKRNGMTAYFIKQKDLEALGYILYAKKAEPFVTGGSGSWEPIKRDSLSMSKLIKNGLQLYAAAKNDNIQLRYAYQVVRLAHYSGNYADAIRYYDQYISPNKTPSVLQDLSLALKAGALFRQGKGKEAAYLFSTAFNSADVKKISNYMSFKWAVISGADRNDYLQLCKNDVENAGMLALFALGSTQSETGTISKIFSLDPANSSLETITVREINKLEETYFTPSLSKEKGGKVFFYSWSELTADSALDAGRKKLQELGSLLEKIGRDAKSNNGFYLISSAYCSLMQKDFGKANSLLAAAKKQQLSPKLNDQLMLTQLLLAINESDKMDAAQELKIMPAVKWLQQKAKKDVPVKNDMGIGSSWQIFYRNIMAEALAKKYHAQGDIYKEVLAIGSADKMFNNNSKVVDFLQTQTDIKDVEQLCSLMTANKGNAFENYLLNYNGLTISDVTDFAGTAYLRNYDYANAIKWLQKSSDKNKSIGKDPFIDLLYDREEAFAKEKKTATKLSFAQEMQRLQASIGSVKLNEAKNYYKMALGLYNMTYYGHAWELVQYYRSGSDGYSIPKDATEFQKQYYGCYAAHDMFKKAMVASTDKNFKARCLLMMAKCAQKAVQRPRYEDFGYNDYDKYEGAEKQYYPVFMNNKYFPQLRNEYAGTAFYKEALTRCSYLRDFVKKK